MKRSTYLLAALALLAAISLSQVGCSGYSGVATAGPAYNGIAYGAAPWGGFYSGAYAAGWGGAYGYYHDGYYNSGTATGRWGGTASWNKWQRNCLRRPGRLRLVGRRLRQRVRIQRQHCFVGRWLRLLPRSFRSFGQLGWISRWIPAIIDCSSPTSSAAMAEGLT